MIALAEKPKLEGFTFDAESHIGRMNGEIWPSVTQLEKEGGLINYDGVPRKKLEWKRILGTRVHHATGLLDENDFDEEHFNRSFPECIPYLEAYRKFRVIAPFEPAPKCGRLVSKKWKFHGEPDEHGVRIDTIEGRLSLIDYKCTFKMFAACGPQLSGYAILLEECFGIKIKDRYGLLFKPTGNYDLVPFKDLTDKHDFLTCLHLHWVKRTKYKSMSEKDILRLFGDEIE